MQFSVLDHMVMLCIDALRYVCKLLVIFINLKAIKTKMQSSI